MIEGVPWLGEISGPAALVLVALLVITEKLIWHKRYDEKKSEALALREQNKELIKQNGILLQSAIPATNAVMNALHQALDNEER